MLSFMAIIFNSTYTIYYVIILINLRIFKNVQANIIDHMFPVRILHIQI